MTLTDAVDFNRAVLARAYVRVVGVNREISWMLAEIFLPMLSVTAYIFLYRALGAPKMYEGLVVLGAAMIPFWLVVLWSMAMQFYWEKEMGNLDIYMASPTNPIALLLGMAIGGLVMGGLRSFAVLLVGLGVFRVELSVTSWPALVVAFVLTLSALFTMGMAAASVYFVTGRKGIKINIALMEPIYMLSGMFFPMKNMGRILGAVASIVPLSIGLDAIRQVTLPGMANLEFLPFKVELGILMVMTVVFGVLALKLMARMERKGKTEGTLTEKWL
ncbi:ABC transporter permease [bacterium]|nr:ABC transporter permease [bacterium]